MRKLPSVNVGSTTACVLMGFVKFFFELVEAAVDELPHPVRIVMIKTRLDNIKIIFDFNIVRIVFKKI